MALAEAAHSVSFETVEREYFGLFLGVGRGELLPYASYYLTGFLNERPLARLRADLKRLGLERAESHFDPEDHLGTLCEIMSGFAGGLLEARSEEHTSELQSLMRISYAVFCLKKKNQHKETYFNMHEATT